jgi:hypothetical protein
MMIQKKDYKDGYAIYGFDLTPSLCDEQYKDPKKDGRIDLNFTFSKNIPVCTLIFNLIAKLKSAKPVSLRFIRSKNTLQIKKYLETNKVTRNIFLIVYAAYQLSKKNSISIDGY